MKQIFFLILLTGALSFGATTPRPGPKGDKGDIGYTGTQGAKGDTGLTGATGAQGIQGVKGDKGDTGLTGSQGIQGPIGLTGSQGIQGVKGDKGDTGLTGSQGVQGPIGLTGAQGAQGIQGETGAQGVTGDSGADGVNCGIYSHFPVVAGVVENDIVMNAVNSANGQAPLSFKKAVNNDTFYYPQIYGVAKNVSGGFADIYIGNGSVVSGFSFGAFIGVEYYLDSANPGRLTWTPPSGVNIIKIGRALDATHLILNPSSNFVQVKGSLYTNDGTGYDTTLLVGPNGNVLVADSPSLTGQKWAPAVVAAAPFTYTLATRTLTIATSTNSVAGILSAADHTTYSGYAATIALKAPLASPVFTGDVNSSSGNVLVSTLGKGLQVKTGTNSKIGTVALVNGVATVANTSVTANSRIFLTSQTDGGTPGFLRVSAKTNGTSFVITSSSLTDTSTVAWNIIESIP